MNEHTGGEEIYLVDKIVDRRIRKKKVEYRVRWKGFPPEQDSWEPFATLSDTCLPLIKEFNLTYRDSSSTPMSDHHRISLSEDGSQAEGEEDSAVQEADTNQQSRLPSRISRKHSNQSFSHQPYSQPHASTSTADSCDTFCGIDNALSSASVNLEYIKNSSPSVLLESSLRNRDLNTSSYATDVERSLAPCADERGLIAISNSSKVRRVVQPSSSNNKVPKSRIESVNDINMSLSVSASSHVATVTTVKTDSPVDLASSQNRKSVTIMLGTPPTHEFKNTKTLDTSYITSDVSQSKKGSSFQEEIKKFSGHKTSKKTGRPVKSGSRTHVDNGGGGSGNTTASKVIAVVCQLKTARRRPIQDHIVAMCERQHGLIKDDVITTLHNLVDQGRIHQIPFNNGISYRFNPSIVARGDLCQPSVISARIKAKYASGAKKKKKKKKPQQQPLSPQSVGTTIANQNVNSTASGNMVTVSLKRASESAPVSSKRVCLEPLWAYGYSRPYYCPYANVRRCPPVQCSEGRKLLFHSMPLSADENCHCHQEKPQNNCNSSNAAVPQRSDTLHPFSLNQDGSRVYVVPPASPTNEASIIRALNSIPSRRFRQSSSGVSAPVNPIAERHATPPAGAPAGDINRYPEGGGGSTPATISETPQSLCNGPFTISGETQMPSLRRSSIRQAEAGYKYNAIVVRKNHGFTEAYFQSPNSRLKNALTVQVLEELSKLLMQVLHDPGSRLLLLSGTGTVFSSGIDLTSLLGPIATNSDSFRVCSQTSVHTTDDATPPEVNRGAAVADEPSPLNNGAPSAHPGADRAPQCCDCCRMPETTDPAVVRRFVSALRHFLLTLVAFPKPVVVGVNGPAVGLAVAFLPLCDLIYVSDTASLHLPYTQLGQPPEAGASYTLAKLVGLPLANELLLAGRKLTAREALQRGLASDLLYPKSFKQQLVMRCFRLAAAPATSMEVNKCIVRMQHRERVECVINVECQKLQEVWCSPEFRRAAVDFLLYEMEDFL